MEILETILHSFVSYAMLLFEYIGVGVITFAGIQGIVNYVRREPDTRLILAKGLAMGLEFKLGSEILRTVIVRNLEEIYIVAGIIVLRAVLTILIHWEIVNEQKEEHLHAEMAKEENAVQPKKEVKEEAAVQPKKEVKEEAAVQPKKEVKEEAAVQPKKEVQEAAAVQPEIKEETTAQPEQKVKEEATTEPKAEA